MEDLNVFQLIQIYLATSNERPIDEMGMLKAYKWTMSQCMGVTTKMSGVCQSETILSNIIAKLVTARQKVQLSIGCSVVRENGEAPEKEPDLIIVKTEGEKDSERL